jgi:hypothetical protein
MHIVDNESAGAGRVGGTAKIPSATPVLHPAVDDTALNHVAAGQGNFVPDLSSFFIGVNEFETYLRDKGARYLNTEIVELSMDINSYATDTFPSQG